MIQTHQEQKLRQILSKASELSYYQDLFQNYQIFPATCTMKDLQRIPILTKNIIRQNFPEEYYRQIPNKKFSYWYTTGSTGTPFAVVTGKNENVMSQALFRYACWKAGLKPTDTLCYIFGDPENVSNKTVFQKIGIGRQYRLNLLTDMANLVDCLKRLKPQALFSYPSYLALLAKYVKENQIQLPSVRLILTGGEVLTFDTRYFLQTALAPIIRDTYGSAEFSRLAYECPYDRMHLIPDAAFIEVINQDAHGVGDALITSLYHRIMPFIRYKIGDRLKLSDEPCRCGVPFQSIEYIEGRCDDVLVLPSGKRISARAINVLEDIPGIVEYQTIQKQPDYFEVHVQKNSQFTTVSAGRIHKRIQEGCLGENVHVEIVFEEGLVRGRTGKLRAVISEVKEGTESSPC